MKVQAQQSMPKGASKILKLAQKNNGIITSTHVTQNNIPRRLLTTLTELGLLYRIDRGVYMLPEAWEDELFNLQWQFSRGIFSHETALYLHNMTDRTPFSYTMTFPSGYNTTNVKERGVIAKTINKENYLLGVTTTFSPYGNKIKVYDIERTLCDIVRPRHKGDIEIVNHAMRQYAMSKNKEVAKLLHYADRLSVKSKILTYMEILL